MSHNNGDFRTLAANAMAATDFGGGSKPNGSISGSAPRGKGPRDPHRIRSTVVTMETPIGSEFSTENQLQSDENDLRLLQGASQTLSYASTTTMETDTTDMESAPWYRVCMTDKHVTSCCPFVRNNRDFIRVRTENIQSLRNTRLDGFGEPHCGRGNRSGGGSGSRSRGGGSGYNIPSTNRYSTGTRTGPSPN